MQCTQCQSDNVQSLRVIYEAGTQRINTSANTYGAGSAGATITGTQQSALARKASPPPKKRYMLFLVLIGFGIVSPFLGLSMSVLFFTVGIGGLFCYLSWRYNTTQYPPKYERWTRSWHCNKCGTIYTVE